MITTTSSKVCYSWSITDITQQAAMHSAYSRKLSAHAGETTFMETVITDDDSDFVEDAIRRALTYLKLLFQATSLVVDSSLEDGNCTIEVTIPDGRELLSSDIDILDSLVETYIVESTLREWAAVTASTTLLARSSTTLEALTQSINEALVWLMTTNDQRGYKVTFPS